MKEKNKFKMDEKVLTVVTDRIGIIKEIVERPEDYKEKYQYLVEFESKFLFFKRKSRSWELESMLGKFI